MKGCGYALTLNLSPIPLCWVKDALLSLTGPPTAITHTEREEEGEMGSFMGEEKEEEYEEEKKEEKKVVRT